MLQNDLADWKKFWTPILVYWLNFWGSFRKSMGFIEEERWQRGWFCNGNHGCWFLFILFILYLLICSDLDIHGEGWLLSDILISLQKSLLLGWNSTNLARWNVNLYSWPSTAEYQQKKMENAALRGKKKTWYLLSIEDPRKRLSKDTFPHFVHSHIISVLPSA